MSSFDVISMGLRNLLKRKLRTFLTMLGVVVGTTAIVMMMSIGIGVNLSFEEQMKNWGDLTLIQVYSWGSYQGSDKAAKVLDDNAIAEIRRLPNVVAATPVAEAYLKFTSGRYLAQVAVRGIDPGSMALFGYEIKEGEFLDADMKGYNIVFSADAPMQFKTLRQINSENSGMWGRYGGMISLDAGMGMAEEEEKPQINPLKDKFKMSYDYNFGEKNNGETTQGKKADVYNVKCVGVLDRSDDWNRSYYSIMSIENVVKINKDQEKWYKSMGGRGGQNETFGYQQGYVKVDDVKNGESVVEAIKALGFTEVYSPTESVGMVKQVAGSLQALLLGAGAIAFFVAAIGIANTMVMAIYERTKEIGVMKVIGAKLSDIRALFLFEAAMIGFFGGIFGIGLSYLGSFVMNSIGGLMFLEWISYGMDSTKLSVIPPWLALAGLAVSVAVGLVSGFLPALRATRISAISAIRSE